MVILGNEKLS